ncbi:uncharacterized protein LOC133814614 [Humulus lupulus]|uniref:uncharacterized protein LOC133814614 n=1 Tax=Humulus lupulus TaxID=3486 RepID=UPI002B40B731|nr:uncharacterized protein LOC133814614 [Humulus lupulus]
MSEVDRIFCFLKGLKPWAKQELQRQRVSDLATAQAVAERLTDYTPESSLPKRATPPTSLSSAGTKRLGLKLEKDAGRMKSVNSKALATTGMDKGAQWVKKEVKNKIAIAEGSDEGEQTKVDAHVTIEGSVSAKIETGSKTISGDTLQTPKKVVHNSKQGQLDSDNDYAAKVLTGQGQSNKNTFEVLQEQVEGEKGVDERKSLWQGLTRLKFPAKPWTILGDFNAIFNVEDRSGGKPVSTSKLIDSSQWLSPNQVDLLKSTGSFFTWTNNQDGQARIYSKIDHIFTNEEWLDFFPNTLVVFRWETVSDHCSCIVSSTSSKNIGVKPFSFYNFWIDHKEFKEVVLESWRKPISGTGLKAIYLKTMRLKHSLKKFNRDIVGDICVNYQKAKDSFQEAQIQAQNHPRDLVFQEEEAAAVVAFNIQEQMKGDANTSYFHACLKKRKEENIIATYLTEQDRLVDNFPDVVSHFLDHFRSFMGSPSSTTTKINLQCIEMGNKLSFEQQLALLKPFSPKEIKVAFFSIPNNQSPGPDGFGYAFFKVLWLDIGGDICKAVSSFFETGHFPAELHNTTISLVPKTDTPARAVDYRPIAYCSTIYKCVFKLMCSRLAKALHGLVQQNQGAFVQGRSISHNILIFQDLIKNYGRKTTSPRCAIKIDLSKAYDTIDWWFLKDLLKSLCFPMRFIGWIMTCLKNTTYSLLMNGRIQGSFKGEKGLRQGDPIYPLLFVLIMEYITRRLQLAAHGTQPSVSMLKEALDEFSSATWLKANTSKSQIYFGGVVAVEREAILMRCNLLKVLFGLRNYCMSIFFLPQSVVKEVEKLCRGFLWGFNGIRSKIHIASWKKVCLPKAYGGLGFRDGSKWNRAILAKYIWAISEKHDLLWVKWINSVYVKESTFWDHKLKSDSSWYWRKLCHLREKFSQTEVRTAGLTREFRASKLYNISLCQQHVDYHQVVWCKMTLPKHRFLLWQVVNSHLLTRDLMIRFCIPFDSLLCPVCGLYNESHAHLFFECYLSQKVTDLVFSWLGFRAWPLEFNGWTNWLASRRTGIIPSITYMTLAAVVYNIWRNRNRCIFLWFFLD